MTWVDGKIHTRSEVEVITRRGSFELVITHHYLTDKPEVVHRGHYTSREGAEKDGRFYGSPIATNLPPNKPAVCKKEERFSLFLRRDGTWSTSEYTELINFRVTLSANLALFSLDAPPKDIETLGFQLMDFGGVVTYPITIYMEDHMELQERGLVELIRDLSRSALMHQTSSLELSTDWRSGYDLIRK